MTPDHPRLCAALVRVEEALRACDACSGTILPPAPVAPPPGFDPTAHRAHGRASRPPEPSNWRRHGPYLRTLAVAIVLTAAAASAGMLMALMGD